MNNDNSAGTARYYRAQQSSSSSASLTQSTLPLTINHKEEHTKYTNTQRRRGKETKQKLH